MSVVEVLRYNVLEGIYEVLVDNGLHAVMFEFPKNEKDIIRQLDAFRFASEVRTSNTWWHIDATDRKETFDLRMTWLYSPDTSSSNIPTWTAETKTIDEASYEFLIQNQEMFDAYDKEKQRSSQKISNILWWEGIKTPWYYTLLLNEFLALKEINIQTQGALRKLRDTFMYETIQNLDIVTWNVVAEKGNTLLLFRNGLWPNRQVAHARFNNVWNNAASKGTVYNISVNEGGIIYPNDDPTIDLPDGIQVKTWMVTNHRKGIVEELKR